MPRELSLSKETKKILSRKRTGNKEGCDDVMPLDSVTLVLGGCGLC